MSKIGKIPVPLSPGVQLTVGHDNVVTVKGPKGELKQLLDNHVQVRQEDQMIKVGVKNPDDRNQRALWGLSRSLINNMVIGVSKGFERKLEINGVGYRAALQGRTIQLNLGFSHPVNFPVPEGIEAKIEKNVITLTGIDKHLIGEVAAQIRRLKPPEPYKGKGIKYLEEVIRRKAGKAVKAAEGKK
ncbi:MAG: 50S ribosomal protein L6 [Patescibacteria group bacterium]